MSRALVGTIVLLVLGAGCGGRAESVSPDGAGVIRDAQDGHIDRTWSCGSLRAAIARSSPAVMSASRVQAAAGRACDRAIDRTKVGMSKTSVRRVMGAPEIAHTDAAGRCWYYTWPRALSSPDPGAARICFNGADVSLVQRLHAFRTE